MIQATQALAAVVGEAHLRPGPPLTVAPATTDEVVAVLAICRQRGLSVVPEGGQTGIVGGTLAGADQVVISLRRMAAVVAIYPDERVITVQAGVTLETVETVTLAHGLEPGIDLASRGSATIGGMVSTNAGGIMAHRYGVMRHRVLGLEAVLPDGTVYSDMTRVVKNTAGYDMKNLFIGAEGTLGVVTRVVLKLEPVPQATATLLLGLPSVPAALTTIRLAMQAEHGHLRAAEGLWQSYLQLTAAALGWNQPSFPLDKPVNLLVMLGGAQSSICTPMPKGCSCRWPKPSPPPLASSPPRPGRRQRCGGCARIPTSFTAGTRRHRLLTSPSRNRKSLAIWRRSFRGFLHWRAVFPLMFSGIWPMATCISCWTAPGRCQPI